MGSFERYIRQIRFTPFGEAGQRRLAAGSVFICGCGALGNFVASLLVRAGVGRVRIADPDSVELVNIHRQILFDEEDCFSRRLKVEAAAEKLRRANSDVTVEIFPVRVTPENVEDICGEVDVIVDATDNFETRYLLNEFAVKRGIPWIFGGVLGVEGQLMTIVPGRTPCLYCLLGECPPPSPEFSCETAGIFGPVVGVIASLQAMEAIKILAGHLEAVTPRLTVIDLWHGEIRQLDVSGLRQSVDCPVCKRNEYRFLQNEGG